MASEPTDLKQRAMNLSGAASVPQYKFWVMLTHAIPPVATIFALYLAFTYGIGWMEITLFVIMGTLGGIGVEVGFHRYFAHKSFKAKKSVSTVLAILGSMTAMGPVFYWAHLHRRHHQHSDTDKDPHSPHDVYDKPRGFFSGLYHAHLGWNYSLYTVDEIYNLKNVSTMSKDLLLFTRSRNVVWVSKRFHWWILLGILLPAAVGGLWTGTWFGFLSGMLWGGLVRVFVGQNVVWGINSVAHTLGSRPLKNKSADLSVNTQYVHLLFCAIGVFIITMTAVPEAKLWGSIIFAFMFMMVTIGGGWHNNHHAYPNVAVQQFAWWQIDPLGWLILLCEKLGLTYDVTLPDKERISRDYKKRS